MRAAPSSPDNWTWGLGERNDPLSEGGYYMTYAQRRKWANQYLDRYYEVRVDTIGMPPTEHHIELALYEDDGEEIRELRRLDSEDIRVIDPEREASQRWATKKAFETAIEMMEAVENGDYDR